VGGGGLKNPSYGGISLPYLAVYSFGCCGEQSEFSACFLERYCYE